MSIFKVLVTSVKAVVISLAALAERSARGHSQERVSR
jgi:hypothetical protein